MVLHIKDIFSAFIYDNIVKGKFTFDEMIYAYLDHKGISRGFLTNSPEALINDFYLRLQLSLELYSSMKALVIMINN